MFILCGLACNYNGNRSQRCLFSFFLFFFFLIKVMPSLVARLVKNPPAMQETLVRFLGRKIPCRRDRLPSPVFSGFSSGSSGKESTCNARNLSLFPGLERSLGKGNSYQLQYFGLENSMDCFHGSQGSTLSGTQTNLLILPPQTHSACIFPIPFPSPQQRLCLQPQSCF